MVTLIKDALKQSYLDLSLAPSIEQLKWRHPTWDRAIYVRSSSPNMIFSPDKYKELISSSRCVGLSFKAYECEEAWSSWWDKDEERFSFALQIYCRSSCTNKWQKVDLIRIGMFNHKTQPERFDLALKEIAKLLERAPTPKPTS